MTDTRWHDGFSYTDEGGGDLDIIICEHGRICVSVCTGPSQASYVGLSAEDAKRLAANILAAVELAALP